MQGQVEGKNGFLLVLCGANRDPLLDPREAGQGQRPMPVKGERANQGQVQAFTARLLWRFVIAAVLVRHGAESGERGTLKAVGYKDRALLKAKMGDAEGYCKDYQKSASLDKDYAKSFESWINNPEEGGWCKEMLAGK